MNNQSDAEDFISFFKSELPEVYEFMWKQFNLTRSVLTFENENRARFDEKGNYLECGETYDRKNKRYMFQKMINRKRVSITAKTLNQLREKEREVII